MNIKEYVNKQKEKIKEIILHSNKIPCLVVIQVNDDPASTSYIRGKKKDALEVGAEFIHVKLDPKTSENELIEVINGYNADDNVDGIIVQMPLPKHINEEHIKLAVLPSKDVDGFHPLSHFIPCTPKGIINYLKAENIVFDGKNAVMIGRSNIVGKPMAKLLLNENSNVTILHSHTSIEDMKFYLEHADIIVVAVGKKYFINHNYNLKKDAVLVDVGINRLDGVLYGDIAPEMPVRLQTPVPGGVGLLTRLSLLENLLEATKK